jgi:hypothetical protein
MKWYLKITWLWIIYQFKLNRNRLRDAILRFFDVVGTVINGLGVLWELLGVAFWMFLNSHDAVAVAKSRFLRTALTVGVLTTCATVYFFNQIHLPLKVKVAFLVLQALRVTYFLGAIEWKRYE